MWLLSFLGHCDSRGCHHQDEIHDAKGMIESQNSQGQVAKVGMLTIEKSRNVPVIRTLWPYRSLVVAD